MTDTTILPPPPQKRRFGGPNGYGHKGDLATQRSCSDRGVAHVSFLFHKIGVDAAAATPSNFSLRAKGCPILDQGPTSSCVGHANAGATFTTLNQTATVTPPIPSPWSFYTGARCIDRETPKAGPLADDGANPASAQVWAQQFGITSMPANAKTSDGRLSDCDEPTINNEPDLGQLEASSSYKLVGQYGIDPIADNFVQLARAAICAGYAINFAVFVDAAFENWDPASGPMGAPNTSDPNGGGHDLYCDGYHEDANGSTIFECVNSWGTGWGKSGYFEGGPAFYTPSNKVDGDSSLGWSAVYVIKVAPVAGDAAVPVSTPA